MATFHLTVKTFSRSQGRSATAAAAYRHAEKIQDQRTGELFDYSHKKDVSNSFIMAPEGAPEWVQDRHQLWNAVELSEKRKDAQVAREVEIALPRELPKQAQEQLLRDYVQRNFVDKGMVADVAIHRPKASDRGPQPHAHVMLTMRRLDAQSPTGFGGKERGWNAKQLVQEWRRDWAVSMNQAYEKHKLPFRVSEKSYKAQGIEQRPQIHMGPKAWNAQQRGIKTQRHRRLQSISRHNRLLSARRAASRQMGRYQQLVPGSQAVTSAKTLNPARLATYQKICRFTEQAAGGGKRETKQEQGLQLAQTLQPSP